MRQAKVQNQVEQILRFYKFTRSDDFQLVIRFYIEFYGVNKIQDIYSGKIKKLPSMESITRARRKLQEKYHELNDPEILKKRLDEQLAYEEFYSKGE